MATGNFWNVDNPEKPWGLFDSNAKLVIPIEIADWLTDMGTTYGSHDVLVEPPLVCLNNSHAAGVISVRMALVEDAPYTPGKKYPFTIRLVGADQQQDDRTLWLKVKER